MSNKPIIAAIIATTFLGFTHAEDLKEKVKRYQEQKLQEHEGVAMASVDGKEIKFASAGALGKDRETVDENTLFEIGSITKVFTGILLADLVQKGEAALDDAISKHLPESVLPADSPLASVTLLDLATHTSGLPRLPGNLADSQTDPGDPYAHYTEKELHEYLNNFQESDFEEKGEQSYSNLGMGLLGHILEHITGKQYEALLAETILDPIGMNSTFVQRRMGDIPKTASDRYATGHSLGKETAHWHIEALCGAGAIVSTTSDLAKFAKAHWDDSTPAELRSAMELAMKNAKNDMGLGWFEKGEGYWHNGGTGGFRSDLTISPKNKTAEIMLTNSSQPSVKTKVAGDFEEIAGFWSGTLDANQTELRQFMRISENGQVVLHSLDQAMRGIPSTSATFDGETLTADFPGIEGKYTGEWNDDTFEGLFEQRFSLPLDFERAEKLPPKLEEFLKQRIDGDVSKVAGFWSGMIGGEGGLFVIFQIESFGGTGEALLFSPDQMPGALPVNYLKIDGDQLELKVDAVNGTYEAEIDDEEMDGTWNQGTPMPLKLEWSETRPERE